MESLKPVDLARMACAAVACVAGFVCLMTATAGTTPEGEAACVLDPTAFAVAVAAAVAYAWLTDRLGMAAKGGPGEGDGLTEPGTDRPTRSCVADHRDDRTYVRGT